MAHKIISFFTAAALILLCGPLAALAAMGQVSIFADPGGDARIADAVSHYRDIIHAGGWPAIPSGPPLRRGVTSDRVAMLRSRLVSSGDLSVNRREGRRFDPILKRAVQRFQLRHGLLVDGIAGPRTLMSLNVPAARRLAALSINRPRLKAWQNQIKGTGVVVNIPDATLELLDNGRSVLRSPVVVGRPDWPTPMLQSLIFAIDVHPLWYVPDRIARQELMPHARLDPDYLEKKGIRVFAVHEDGRALREVPYRKINFSNADRLGYRLRQDSGPRNALGVVKFVFDNPYSVFLHDTPDRQFFTHPKRSLSHGCIRVAAALDLARYLVADDPGIGVKSLAAAIEAGKTLRLRLSRPIPIHLVYLTAWVDLRRRVQFRRDFYGYDQPQGPTDPVLAACGGKPKEP